MTTRFVLVQHAACAQMDNVLLGRTADVGLDAHGRVQARNVATQLAQEHPALVASSPRLRARQTAVAIAAHAACAMRTCDEFDEVDFGEWSGRSFAELARDARWQHWNTHRAIAATPAGDTMVRVRERASAALRSLGEEFADRTIVVVTHAEVIRAVQLRARHIPARSYWTLAVPPASMHVLLLQGAEFRPADMGSLAA